jgi:hypothetical protein
LLNPKTLHEGTEAWPFPTERPTTAESLRSTGLHELGGHGVSFIEGFPAGGGFESPEVVAAAQRSLPLRRAEYQTNWNNIVDRQDAWVAAERKAGSPFTEKQLQERYFNEHPDEEALARHVIEERAKDQRGRMQLEEQFKHYQALAGENDARLIQARADMTQEQLRATSRESMQEVPFAEQLIRYGKNPRRAPTYPPQVPPPTVRPGLLDRPVQDVLPPTGTTPQGRFNFQQEPPSFTERMSEAQGLAQERRNRGLQSGDYGLGSARRTAPDAPPGSFADFAARQRQGYRNDMADILDAYRERTGLPRQGTQSPLLAPGERDLQLNTRLPPEDVSGPVTGVGRPAAPYIRNLNAPLFDYSRLNEVPEVPQFDLPRLTPPKGTAQAYLDLARNRPVLARTSAAAEAGMQHGRPFYNTQPLRAEYRQEYGAAEPGDRAYRDYIGAAAATSVNTPVPQNIRNASYFNYLRQTGQPMPSLVKSPESAHLIVPPGSIPEPYGNTAQAHYVRFMNDLIERGEFGPEAQKLLSYQQNLLGNYRPVTIDRHNMRSYDLPWDQPGKNYGALEGVQHGQAGQLNVEPAQWQGGLWFGDAERTGVRSGTEPFLRVLEQRLADTAEQRGLTKVQMLKEFLRARQPIQ